MTSEIKEIEEVKEPVLYNGETQWLIIKESIKAPESKHDIRLAAKNDLEPEKTNTFKLKKQGLWQCKKCGCIVESNPEKPTTCPEEQGGCGRTTSFEQITKFINKDLWELPIWNDIPIDDIDMLGTYDDLIKLLKQCIIFVEEIHYKLLALWIISSWKFGSWDSFGIPFFVGLEDSGKTRGLELICKLGWRFVLSTNATFPAMVRASHYYSAGICLDEVHNKLTPFTEEGQKHIDFIKPGYRKGSKYLVADKEDQEAIISYNNFSFKAFAGEKYLDDRAMMSRCVLFDMEKDNPEIDELATATDEITRIKTILLNYRYKFCEPPSLPDDTPLRGRIKEIFGHVVRTGMHLGVNIDGVLDFALRAEKERLQAFQDSIEYEILNLIKNRECHETLDDAPEIIIISDILDGLGWDGKTKGQTAQSLGYKLKNIGVSTSHTREGKVIKLTDPKISRKLKYLFKRYGV